MTLKQLANTEKQCWVNAKYLQRECVKTIGISKTSKSTDLEHTVCKIFNSVCSDIAEDRIEACHQFIKSESTIVKFSGKNECQHLMSVKKGLKDLDPKNLSFSEGTKIYVNDSLCPWGLWDQCKKLWNNKKI